MKDDYKDEYLPRLQKSYIYSTLKNKCYEKDTEVVALVENAISYAVQRTKMIVKHMGEFTLHDSDHLFRVLTLEEKLLTKHTINNLSTPELMLLIISAFFHDIGMAPDEKQVLTWKKVWDKNPEISNEEEQDFNEFNRFYLARPEQQESIEQLIKQEKYSNVDTIKAYLITEFIRKSHAERAREIIEKDWNRKIRYHDTDLTVDFAQICYSHNDDALFLLELEKDYLCAENTTACLPLIGVILRLCDILDFDAKRTPAILFSNLFVRDPISLKEWNKHRAIKAWEINTEKIQFNAKCNHPAIEASIHKFCDLIDRELSVCNNVILNLNEFNNYKNRDIAIKIPFTVNREKITTEKDIRNKPLYIYRDTQFTLSKRQVIDLLMGTKLYGNREVALRELLQNSIDACLLRQAQEKKWGNPYNPEIFIKYYSENDISILEIEDNGTGMDQHIIDNYYSKVGSSFYKSTDFYNLKSESNADFTPTSRFGIGILSCFMVADTLIVDTKRVIAPHKSSEALTIKIEGQESIFWIKEGKREKPGTTTKLILRKEKNPWNKINDNKFIQSVENVIPNPPFKINIQTNLGKELKQRVRDENSFKEVTVDSLKDYTWVEHEYIKYYTISLNRTEDGIVGSALVAILEQQGLPVELIELTSKKITIDNKKYTLENKLHIIQNEICQNSNSIYPNNDGGISERTITNYFTKSKSRLSLHGIEVPTTLFPESWNRRNNQVELSLPFPILIVVDIYGNRDLDLNSSRTEIIISEKWFDFEEKLIFIICTELAKLVNDDYWIELKEILGKSKNENFIRVLNKVTK